MSRPPLNRSAPSPRSPDPGRYFGPDFAALVALAEAVARDRHGIEIPAKGRGLARTLIELPALLAHILGEHQSLYAREAFLASAALPENLGRHARKLAYSPDPGVAATGLAAFTVKPGLSGTLPKGFALQSSALGEARAETYETLADTAVDAAWNAIRPADAEVFDPVQADRGYLELGLQVRHGLEAGEIVLLQGRSRIGVFRVVEAFAGARPARIGLYSIGGHGFADAGSAADWQAGYRLLARPRIRARLFGWNAEPALWPAGALANPGAYAAPASTSVVGTVTHGYAAPASAGQSLMLAETVEPPAFGSLVAVVGPTLATPYALEAAGEAVVAFVRGEQTAQPVVTTSTGTNGQTTVSVTTQNVVVETRLSARATTLTLLTLPGATQRRVWTSFPLDARILTDWADEIAALPMIPNAGPLAPEFAVAADLSAMRPGRPAILRRISTGAVRAASVA
ncbi:MAG: hypothetical protein JNK88_05410, partial [Mangrovicoccus sp.]|nr:hypothetical protein [Mangrovicoccus sp.]